MQVQRTEDRDLAAPQEISGGGGSGQNRADEKDLANVDNSEAPAKEIFHSPHQGETGVDQGRGQQEDETR